MNKDRKFGKKTAIFVLALAGLVLILLSYFSESRQNSSDAFYDPYGEHLEAKLRETLGFIVGSENIRVMITFKGTKAYEKQESVMSFDVQSSNEENMDYPEIAGVMIVYSGVFSPTDIANIKRAVSVGLDIEQNKINIIGGYGK